MSLENLNLSRGGPGESSPSIPRGRTFPLGARAFAFGLSYYLCAQASMLMNLKGSPSASLWLPAGLFVATLLLTEYKEWAWMVGAAAVSNTIFDSIEPTPRALIPVFIVANTLQALLAAWLVRKFVARRPCMNWLRDYAGLLLFAALLSTFVGGLVSACGQEMLGLAPSFWKSLANWWGSTSMSVLIVSPFVLAWASFLPWRKETTMPANKVFEAAVLYVGLIAVVWWLLVHGLGIKSPNKSPVLVFLIWSGLRFGVRGATLANLIIVIMAGYLTERYQVGLTQDDITTRIYVLELQLGLAIGTTLGLIPAIILAEHQRTLLELRKSEEKFAKAFQSSPIGIALSELDTGRHIEVNDTFCRICGYPREEVVGRTSVELGIFRDMAERERIIAPVRTIGQIRNCKLTLPAGRQGGRTVLVSAERIELGGRQCVVLVVADVTERLEAEARLEQSGQQLRALAYRVQSLREEERTALAREIHDHLGQLLTALSLDLRLLERKAGGVTDADLRAALHGKISSARGLADETITSVQKIATELRPPTLDRLGLEAAIETEAQSFQMRTGVECRWALPAEPLAVTPDQATAIFRIFQEILTNVARHAQAKMLSVRLQQGGGDLVLEVDDDGVGIKPEHINNPTSLGLLGMQERAAILGGRVTFGRKEPAGTSVVVRVPLGGKAAVAA